MNQLARRILVQVICLCLAWTAAAQKPAEETPGTPDADIPLSPLVKRVLEDPLTDPDERDRLRVFHGQWDELGELAAGEQERLALLRYELDAPQFSDERADPLIRAAAALHRGEPEQTIALLAESDSAQAALLRARAHEQRGEPADAVAVLSPVRDRLNNETIEDAAELTAAAEALVMLARLEGRPAQDWDTAIDLLGKARNELDPLYWPALIAEADLLNEKDNRKEAVAALADALALNPVCSEAWHRLGVLAAEGYDFDRAAKAVDKLRQINPEHVLGDVAEIRSLLTQKDVSGARTVVERALERYPTNRELIALLAATEALAFDEPAMRAAMDRFDALAPGAPLAHHTVGYYLSMARQYALAETMLREAVSRQPNAAAPRIDLGLLLVQAGKNEEARKELTQAVGLDKFHKRAANSLRLVEELLSYQVIETDHFIIRYQDGIDAVLARDMPPVLERIYEDITSIFEHEPGFKTQIDLLPDEKYFGVRITGMPEIWTIAAATGPAIGLTPPREGAQQRGTFDWANVIRHEFVHTVTLDQTSNRVPHWFTEACAVSQELTGRTFETCQLLAWALAEDKLFDYDHINWGFVRPKAEHERPLAYAQADWMLEFIAYRHGHRAIVDMLNLFREGVPDAEVLQQVTGESPDAFMENFRGWAAKQVEQWGLAESQKQDRDRLLEAAQAALDAEDVDAARQAVLRYATACPVDPWPHRALVNLGLRNGNGESAGAEVLASLEQLDMLESSSGDWAYQLAQIHRANGPLNDAAAAIERALRREPYNATYRELAATIELQRGESDRALNHLESLAILEPDRAKHHVRLAALYHRLERAEDARAAAARAREIDPDAPVGQFID